MSLSCVIDFRGKVHARKLVVCARSPLSKVRIYVYIETSLRLVVMKPW
jgi:hypothetical protein